jgi:hypothetical protein
MSTTEWFIVLVGVGFLVVGWQLSKMAAHLSQLKATLQSIDAEVFHLAQEQNPNYGLCDSCGRRAIVRHVVPKDHKSEVETLEMFYCQSCWWMSDSVQVSDETKYYKDHLSERDRLAARIGPG